MRLLFDANLSPGLAGALQELYPGSIHVVTVGLECSDTAIWNYAKDHDLVIVSKDADFEQRAMVYGAPPKVIWIRLGNCRTGVVESLLRLRFEQIVQFQTDSHSVLLALP